MIFLALVRAILIPAEILNHQLWICPSSQVQWVSMANSGCWDTQVEVCMLGLLSNTFQIDLRVRTCFFLFFFKYIIPYLLFSMHRYCVSSAWLESEAVSCMCNSWEIF